MKEIEQWYDNEYDEWNRLERHKVEFEITKRYMEEYINGEQLAILDIGGGPGRYSIFLAKKGHKVTLLDLSKHNLEIAKEKSVDFGVDLKDYIHGNALSLKNYKLDKFDVVLLMGPLYHLIKEEDRKLAVKEALDLLKPGGILFASFISVYAPVLDYLAEPSQIETSQELLNYLTNGVNSGENGFTTAYFTSITDAKNLMNEFGVKELVFAGVENVLGGREEKIDLLDEFKTKQWLEIGYRLSKDENLLGTSHHYLYIGQK